MGFFVLLTISVIFTITIMAPPAPLTQLTTITLAFLHFKMRAQSLNEPLTHQYVALVIFILALYLYLLSLPENNACITHAVSVITV